MSSPPSEAKGMPLPERTILVTGATGRQGKGVITALLASPLAPSYTILALTRNPSSPAAQHLTTLSPRIHLLQGDLDADLNALFRTAADVATSTSTETISPTTITSSAQSNKNKKKVWGVFSVQVSLGPGVTSASETRQGIALIDAAMAHGVDMFVYSSVDRGGDTQSWSTPTPIGHFASKHAVEQHLRRVTEPGQPGEHLKWTILRPVAFMDNLKPGFETKVFLAALRNYLPPTKKLQWVASGDVGAYAAMAFATPGEWDGRAVGVAGDELTMDELSEVFERAVGRPARGTYWVLGSVLTTLVREMALMIGWFASDGYGADVRARRAEYPGLLDLEGYLRGNGEWQAVAVR